METTTKLVSAFVCSLTKLLKYKKGKEMKVTITTLTGEKFDVEVKAEDKVKDIKVSNQRQLK